jgi:hypothetical protein
MGSILEMVKLSSCCWGVGGHDLSTPDLGKSEDETGYTDDIRTAFFFSPPNFSVVVGPHLMS